MSYSFPKDQANGTEIQLSNGVTYKYNALKKTWGVEDVAGGGSVSKLYIDTAVAGSTVGAGRKFSGVNVMPSSSNYFATDAAQPKDVKKIWMHDDFLTTYIEGPGKSFKGGGWIDIHDVGDSRETLGMYFVYNLATDSNGRRYFTVHGMSTTNRNLIVGYNYGMSFACSFNS